MEACILPKKLCMIAKLKLLCTLMINSSTTKRVPFQYCFINNWLKPGSAMLHIIASSLLRSLIGYHHLILIYLFIFSFLAKLCFFIQYLLMLAKRIYRGIRIRQLKKEKMIEKRAISGSFYRICDKNSFVRSCFG